MPGRVELVGVYRLPVSEEFVRSEAELLYGENPSADQLQQMERQLLSTVLVEVLVSNADADFDVGDFTQENPNLPRANWQVAWAEAFLSTDGERLLVERWEPLPPGHADFRVAFFMHEWLDGQLLSTSYGTLRPAQPTPLPDRLIKVVPYELVD